MMSLQQYKADNPVERERSESYGGLSGRKKLRVSKTSEHSCDSEFCSPSAADISDEQVSCYTCEPRWPAKVGTWSFLSIPRSMEWNDTMQEKVLFQVWRRMASWLSLRVKVYGVDCTVPFTRQPTGCTISLAWGPRAHQVSCSYGSGLERA